MGADRKHTWTGVSSKEHDAPEAVTPCADHDEWLEVHHRKPSKILLVDDEALFRSANARVLRHYGYQVLEAADGRDAERSFLRNHPDLIITDMCMPGRDGLETIRKLGDLDPLVPVIAMSGSGRLVKGDYLTFAHYLGAVWTLEKPFSIEDLLTAVRSALPVREDDWALAE